MARGQRPAVGRVGGAPTRTERTTTAIRPVIATGGSRDRSEAGRAIDSFEVMVDDVFGTTSGSGAERGDGSVPDPDGLDPILAGAALWGMELEPRFRVLAVTLEPTPERDAWADRSDRRLQLLCFPVSTMLGSLRRHTADDRELLAFTEQQLVDVAAAFGGAPMDAPLFGRPEPRPGEWGPQFSLQGRSTAPDGTRRTLTVSVRHEDLSLQVFARFDELELRDPDGAQLPWPPPGPTGS